VAKVARKKKPGKIVTTLEENIHMIPGRNFHEAFFPR
jgi:hypothetical protein